jgi:hypothetical protein
MWDKNTQRICKDILHGLTVFLLLGMIALSAQADTVNLIQNGDFSKVNNNTIKAQNWNSPSAKSFKVSFPQEAERGTVAHLDVSTGATSGYFIQNIMVKPHTNYHFSALTKIDKGKVLIWIHGDSGKTKLDSRLYVDPITDVSLVPWFWDKKWVEGSSLSSSRRYLLAMPGEWEPVSINFNSGDLETVTIAIGAYFQAGRYEFDDVSVTEIPTTTK